MALLSGIFYFIGLIALSVTTGNLYIAAYGFVVFGIGLILFPVFHALICMLYRRTGLDL